MKSPVLSICIPTFNRVEYLKQVLHSIVSQNVFANTDDVEIIISDNCSTDATASVIEDFIKIYPKKIKYIRQKEQLGVDRNIVKIATYANGEFIKINNDTCAFNPDSLTKMLADIEIAKTLGASAILFTNSCAVQTKHHLSFDDLLNNTGHCITWIGAHCYQKTFWEQLDNRDRSVNTKLNQVDIIGRLFEKKNTLYVSNESYFDSLAIKNKSGYNVAEIFGKNYLELLYTYHKLGLLSKKSIENSKKKLLKFINHYYFDVEHDHNFFKTGYFKYIFKYYWNKLYFYEQYIKIIKK